MSQRRRCWSRDLEFGAGDMKELSFGAERSGVEFWSLVESFEV